MAEFDLSSPAYAKGQSILENWERLAADAKESNPGAAEKQKSSETRVRFRDPDPDHRLDHPVRPNGPYLKPPLVPEAARENSWRHKNSYHQEDYDRFKASKKCFQRNEKERCRARKKSEEKQKLEAEQEGAKAHEGRERLEEKQEGKNQTSEQKEASSTGSMENSATTHAEFFLEEYELKSPPTTAADTTTVPPTTTNAAAAAATTTTTTATIAQLTPLRYARLSFLLFLRFSP